MCSEENITFSNDMEHSNIYLGIVPYGENCYLNLTFSTCAQSINESKLSILIPEGNVRIEFYNIEKFYGNHVSVQIENDCDPCIAKSIYMPDMKPTG